MKSVLARIDPKWGKLLETGQKTVDVHLSVPSAVPFRVYLYNPSAGPENDGGVIGEYVCTGIDEFKTSGMGVCFKRFRALHQSCMSIEEMKRFAKKGVAYGWQVSNLVMYIGMVPLTQVYEPCSKRCERCKYYCYDPHDEMPGFGESYCGMGDVESNLQPPEDWCYVEPLL